jgi:hypothetical protein
MKNRFIDTLYLSVFLVIVGLILPSNSVFAQTGTSKGLTVIPPKFELFANPGDTVTEKVRLRNESDFPVTYNVITEDFTSSGEEGAVALEDQTSTNTNYVLANWITPELKDISLQPKEESTFNFKIDVPKDAEPGGHYASILFSSGGETQPGAASVTSRIGSLILLRISGNVKETAAIETFEAPNYSQKGPVVFTLRMKNDGNVHIRPKGTIIITNLLNQKVAEIPLAGANVLPGAVRKMDTSWDQTNPLGVFTATLVATYGQQNLPLTSAIRFTVISPLAAILITLAIVAAIVFLITLITGRHRFKKALKALTDN